jgi:hypothetical protein
VVVPARTDEPCSTADLHVDPPPTSDRRFQLDVEILFTEVQPAVEQKRLDIGLEVRLSAAVASREPSCKLVEVHLGVRQSRGIVAEETLRIVVP